jgi:hypothetical protein
MRLNTMVVRKHISYLIRIQYRSIDQWIIQLINQIENGKVLI